MKVSEAKQGRVFIIRLEDGDILHESIEQFARESQIVAGACLVLGGADAGSQLVVGPADGRASEIEPMAHLLDQVHEITGTGTLFPDKQGNPVLHMHIACGSEDQTITGCVRRGVRVWHVMEVVLFELLQTRARRLPDAATGFELLVP